MNGMVAHLDCGALARLERLGKSVSFKRGERLFSEGDRVDSAYLIRTGKVRLLKTDDQGRQLVIRVMQAGDLAAVPTIFTRTPHIVTAEAVSEVNALKVEQGALVRIIEDHRAVMHAIVRYLSSLLRDAWEAGYSSSIRLGRERLAEQLVNRFQFLEGEPQGRRRQSLKISRTELAEITGLAKETVSRLLMELVRSQAIAVEGRSVRILDMAQLRRLAGSTR